MRLLISFLFGRFEISCALMVLKQTKVVVSLMVYITLGSRKGFKKL
jgi:hypothetical protein